MLLLFYLCSDTLRSSYINNVHFLSLGKIKLGYCWYYPPAGLLLVAAGLLLVATGLLLVATGLLLVATGLLLVAMAPLGNTQIWL